MPSIFRSENGSFDSFFKFAHSFFKVPLYSVWFYSFSYLFQLILKPYLYLFQSFTMISRSLGTNSASCSICCLSLMVALFACGWQTTGANPQNSEWERLWSIVLSVKLSFLQKGNSCYQIAKDSANTPSTCPYFKRLHKIIHQLIMK